jgi:hypothetical protein
MTFSDPSLLWALAALAIPLAIHLLGRRRTRCAVLPTARFAEAAHQEARGRLRLKRAALLGLRLAAIALLLLALAGPQLVRDAAPGAASASPAPAQPSEKQARDSTAAEPRAIRILIVDAAEEKDARLRSADLVAAALGGETDVGKTIARRRASEVDRPAFDAADVVFWVGSQAASRAAGIEAFSERAGLVWMPADLRPPDPDLAGILAVRQEGPQADPDGYTIDPAAYASDLVQAFEAGTSGDLAAPVFRKRLRLDAAEAGAIRFHDGAPAIVDRRRDKGRVVAMAAGPGPAWGDLARRAEFVVLMHSLAEALAPDNAAWVPLDPEGLDGQGARPAPSATPARRTTTAGPKEASPTFIDLSAWFVLALAAALAAETVLSASRSSARRALT